MPTTVEEHQNKHPDLEWHQLPTPEAHPRYTYHGFQPGRIILSTGHVRSPGRRPFTAHTILDKDVSIPMRDGIKLYADIFRPCSPEGGEQKVPAIIPWSPYGKTGNGCLNYDNIAPFRVGLHLNQTSGYEKFEGPDPADWVPRGYAIVNIDARGAGDSEGNMVFWGQQEAEDIYDAIDWVSKQSWCNSSVGMAGNSWLAIAQINFASRLEHPALKAIAPWEGRNDMYRDSLARGGKKHNAGFQKFILAGFAGRNSVENMPLMLEKRPLFDDYWESKYMNTERISIPAYVVASFSSMLHSRGSFETFRSASSHQKWLRVHPYQEWYDLYRGEMVDDLQSGGNTKTICERPELAWPLPRQTLKKFHLNAAQMELQPQQPHETSSVSYDSQDLKATSDFTMFFQEYTEIAGYAKSTLWMSCKDKDDFDIAVQIRKLSRDGKPLEHLNYPCPVPCEQVPDVNTAKCLGPQGFLRASHRITKDPERSTDQEVFYRHDKREAIPPGSIVKLEITLWPVGMVFAPGEGLMLRVSGHDMCYPETETIGMEPVSNENIGEHVIHTGGRYESSLVLPFI
ncbi:hypothetical protein N7517_010526 [Penicillium concentricum]|uniref:Xaa-Pro dipeptidyl-peptidase C-terminal domain-containing protein n=1 Tax=Penicillium concentricum TaxID=293559 RepID=A0A9W9USP5_9EURO|nr:uncharacterized protein N7517_010526 [Penicillium concentricum]KAJ5355917.1 hypothetical protein N7517_010526 [Penicillium concentricum]